MRKKINRVVITVSGGVVQQIMLDEPVEIHVFDFDDIEAGGDFPQPSISKADQLTASAYAELVQDVEEAQA